MCFRNRSMFGAESIRIFLTYNELFMSIQTIQCTKVKYHNKYFLYYLYTMYHSLSCYSTFKNEFTLYHHAAGELRLFGVFSKVRAAVASLTAAETAVDEGLSWIFVRTLTVPPRRVPLRRVRVCTTRKLLASTLSWLVSVV